MENTSLSYMLSWLFDMFWQIFTLIKCMNFLSLSPSGACFAVLICE